MSIVDIILILVVAVLFGLALKKTLSHKEGGCAGCSSCGSCSGCHSAGAPRK